MRIREGRRDRRGRTHVRLMYCRERGGTIEGERRCGRKGRARKEDIMKI